MRVISGSAKGRKLFAPEGLSTRPTTDRVKESVFNIITPFLPAENVLDLFAGSGGLGIETLSRGSKHCTFVETDKSALSVIRKNLELARLSDRADVIGTDALNFLKRTSTKFDVIFLDPPYNTGLLTDAIKTVYQSNLLADGGIIVAESEYLGEAPTVEYFDIKKQVKYGKTTIFVLCRKQERGQLC